MNSLIAIIGTAGRDKSMPMTKALWGRMQRDVLARVSKGAQCGSMIAYTWGESDTPMNGGTRYTWDRCRGIKQHVSLQSLI